MNFKKVYYPNYYKTEKKAIGNGRSIGFHTIGRSVTVEVVRVYISKKGNFYYIYDWLRGHRWIRRYLKPMDTEKCWLCKKEIPVACYIFHVQSH